MTTGVVESTKDNTQIVEEQNYDNRKDEECDPEGGYKSLVEEIAESVDVARETARLDGLSAYIVVSGLMSTTSISVCLGVIGFLRTTLEATILTVSLCFLQLYPGSLGYILPLFFRYACV